MAVLFLIFIVIPLILAGALMLALAWGATTLLLRFREKRMGLTAPSLNQKERREFVVKQVLWSYILLLVGFLCFLVVRYYTT